MFSAYGTSVTKILTGTILGIIMEDTGIIMEAITGGHGDRPQSKSSFQQTAVRAMQAKSSMYWIKPEGRLHERVTTVFPCQGKFAHDPKVLGAFYATGCDG